VESRTKAAYHQQISAGKAIPEPPLNGPECHELKRQVIFSIMVSTAVIIAVVCFCFFYLIFFFVIANQLAAARIFPKHP